MTIIIQEITDKAQWNGFLTGQPRGHLLQSYEWGEVNQYLGGHIYRLGAMENGQLSGAMMLTVSPVPVPTSTRSALQLALQLARANGCSCRFSRFNIINRKRAEDHTC